MPALCRSPCLPRRGRPLWRGLSRVALHCSDAAPHSLDAESSAARTLAASPVSGAPPGSSRILLLGEGNFTFALAMKSARPDLKIVATSLTSRTEAEQVWGAGPALEQLRASGVECLHGVDATQLRASPLAGAVFDSTVFLFPHCGQKGRVQMNRVLLAATCASFARDLRCSSLEIALASGQGGTEADAEQRRAWGWQLPLAAAAGGLLVTEAHRFEEAAWMEHGYRSAGCWRGMGRGTRDLSFRTTQALVHRLQPAAEGCETPFPLTFAFNCSFWTDGDAPTLDELLVAGQEASEGVLMSVDRVSEWTRPEDGRRSICIRLVYRSSRLPLTELGARELHARVAAGVVEALPAARLTLRTKANEKAPQK
jgi:Domain of unknown function (DUF2431)